MKNAKVKNYVRVDGMQVLPNEGGYVIDDNDNIVVWAFNRADFLIENNRGEVVRNRAIKYCQESAKKAKGWYDCLTGQFLSKYFPSEAIEKACSIRADYGMKVTMAVVGNAKAFTAISLRTTEFNSQIAA